MHVYHFIEKCFIIKEAFNIFFHMYLHFLLFVKALFYLHCVAALDHVMSFLILRGEESENAVDDL